MDVPVIPISEIIIGERHRHDMGDIAGLAVNINAIGLLHPVVITKDNVLVAGARRIEAAKLLGWRDITVRVVDMDAIVVGELAENELRKDFTVSERVAIGKAVEAQIGNRQGQRTDKLSEGPREVEKGKKTSEQAAAKAGFGNETTYRQAKAVVTAADAEPEKFGKLVEEMDTTGKVQGPHKKLKTLKRSAADIAKADRAEAAAKAKTKPKPSAAAPPDAPEDLRRSRSAKKPQPPKSALAEFKVAVDIWFSKMDDDAKREAVEYVIAKGAEARADRAAAGGVATSL
jgi:ParB-like chromosome segregation protein Spo0J